MIEELKERLSDYWQLLNRSIPPLGISLLLHLLLIVAVVAAGITTFEKKPVARTATPVIQAHAVDGAQLRALAEQKRKKAEAEKQAKRRAEEKRKEKARKKREKAKKEKAKKAKAKKEKAKREKAKKEKARKAKEKKKKEAARKKREKEKKRKAAEKKKAEKRKAEARRKKQQQQMLLDAELEMEQLLRAGRAGGGDRERGRLQAQIRQQIEGVWRKPPGTPVGRSCKVKVRLLSDGGVGRITMITRSGNEAFDLSVGQAIHEAAPFPLPESVELRREVSELEMIFVHEG